MGYTCVTEDCFNPVENQDLGLCASCNSDRRKAEKSERKANEKRSQLIEKQKVKSSQPRQKAISKNPNDWNNTFLCSDGTRVTQADINKARNYAYDSLDQMTIVYKCQGCSGKVEGHAHVIPQARCKVIGKTELIWHSDNFFFACNSCNAAIENPKGKEWKLLKNIEKCLSFIKQHDHELYMKFQLSAVNQEKIVI